MFTSSHLINQLEEEGTEDRQREALIIPAHSQDVKYVPFVDQKSVAFLMHFISSVFSVSRHYVFEKVIDGHTVNSFK